MNEPNRNATVLLVEDDDNDIVLMQRAIYRAGVAVDLHFVRDGEQAIMYLAGNGPYADQERHPLPILIFLDLKLPRRSGHEVLKWVRAQKVLKRIPVIILTSSMEPEDINKAYDLGANSCLYKPVTFEPLADAMKALETYWIRINQGPNS